jgi:hypothetical protein
MQSAESAPEVPRACRTSRRVLIVEDSPLRGILWLKR